MLLKICHDRYFLRMSTFSKQIKLQNKNLIENLDVTVLLYVKLVVYSGFPWKMSSMFRYIEISFCLVATRNSLGASRRPYTSTEEVGDTSNKEKQVNTAMFCRSFKWGKQIYENVK